MKTIKPQKIEINESTPSSLSKKTAKFAVRNQNTTAKLNILLLNTPFMQLNTPYPATLNLKGYLKRFYPSTFQADLGIELIDRIFSQKGLGEIFDLIETTQTIDDGHDINLVKGKKFYLETIELVMSFLRNPDAVSAQLICQEGFLPKSRRFFQNDTDYEFAFGSSGILDKAKFMATLYLEDLGDLVKSYIDPDFGFSRYAEHIGICARVFDPIYAKLEQEETYLIQTLHELLEQKMVQYQPDLVGISVPFPGNLFSALKCGQYIKRFYPSVKIVIGGGYVNTELRQIADARFFEFCDFLCFDDGEKPLQLLCEHLEGKRGLDQLKRTAYCSEGQICWSNSPEPEDRHEHLPVPDYSDLPLGKYISVLELTNPMHRLWSDGRWNKLTLAHGCYWHKCSFCDVSLDYISRYEPSSAKVLVDKIEAVVRQTGVRGFHFTDEAAPPALLKQLALELIERRVKIAWWTNIRFEKAFTNDLAQLLASAGCIAVSGGLEVASDRLLQLMNKGVSIGQVAQTTHHLTSAGIMVHAYLMYGFPTETAQETIDSLEVVRQLFENRLLHSAFWHRFVMTSHSPVGLSPEQFKVNAKKTGNNPFANNDLPHHDPTGAKHELFSAGLAKAVYNYMHDLGLDFSLDKWFDTKVPKTTVPRDLVRKMLQESSEGLQVDKQLYWLNPMPDEEVCETSKKGKTKKQHQISFYTKNGKQSVKADASIGVEIMNTLRELLLEHKKIIFKDLLENLESKGLDIEFLNSEAWRTMRKNGMLLI